MTNILIIIKIMLNRPIMLIAGVRELIAKVVAAELEGWLDSGLRGIANW